MTMSTTRTFDGVATKTTSASAAPSAIDSVDRERSSSRREAVLATALVGLVAAVVLFGLAFPELLAPAVAIAVLAVIVALDLILPSGELRQMLGNHRTS
jgi:protein-S-isoprenylcysteine O-methyltransferase Ste14